MSNVWRKLNLKEQREILVCDSPASFETVLERQKERPTPLRKWAQKCAGGDVLSHRVAPAVPSARQSLTTVFEMGTGVSSALRPPATSPTTSIEAVKQASSKQRVEKGRDRPQAGPTHVQACVSLK